MSDGSSASLRQSNLKLISHSLKKTEGVATMVSTPSRPLLAPTWHRSESNVSENQIILWLLKGILVLKSRGNQSKYAFWCLTFLGFKCSNCINLLLQLIHKTFCCSFNFKVKCKFRNPLPIQTFNLTMHHIGVMVTWPWTQVQFVSSSFHLMPIWNSNFPLDVLCRKGEKRNSHRVNRKKAFWRTFVFFCRRFAPRYISWPRELRYSGIIRSEIEAAVSFWKSFWTFLKTLSMSRSFLLIWLSKCFM